MDKNDYRKLNRKQLIELLIKALNENEKLKAILSDPVNRLDSKTLETILIAIKEKSLKFLNEIEEIEKIKKETSNIDDEKEY